MLFMLLLRKLYRNKFCRFLLYEIWGFISLAKLLFFSIENRNFIFHIDIFCRNLNVGDNILYSRLEKAFNIFSDNTNEWFHRLAF
jgi:hypothetical protein